MPRVIVLMGPRIGSSCRSPIGRISSYKASSHTEWMDPRSIVHFRYQLSRVSCIDAPVRYPNFRTLVGFDINRIIDSAFARAKICDLKIQNPDLGFHWYCDYAVFNY